VDPIEGRDRVIGASLDIADRIADVMLLDRTVNGQPGLVAQQDVAMVTIFAFDVADDRIRRIWVVRNPEKLRSWSEA
jgi:RNA polymerase sigma-70 factor (ECF subfamily)